MSAELADVPECRRHTSAEYADVPECCRHVCLAVSDATDWRRQTWPVFLNPGMEPANVLERAVLRIALAPV